MTPTPEPGPPRPPEIAAHYAAGREAGRQGLLCVGIPGEYQGGAGTIMHELAVITECCTGCAASPACVEYFPVEDCMFWVPDEDHPPFGRIQVDPILCIGCKKCTSKGPDGCFLDGCPWDAISMVDTVEVEKEIGAMPY